MSEYRDSTYIFFLEISSFVVYLGSYDFCADKIVFGSRSAMQEWNGATYYFILF